MPSTKIVSRCRCAPPIRSGSSSRGAWEFPRGALPRPRVVAAPAPIAAEPPQVVAEAPAASDEDWPGETAVAEPVFRPSPESHWPSQNGLSGESDGAESER